MRWMWVVLIVLLIAVQYALWFSSGGLVQVWQLKHSITQLKSDNAQLVERNSILEADVQDLKKGNEAIEEKARHDLGMIKQNETFYQIVK